MATLVLSLLTAAESKYEEPDAPILKIDPKYSPVTASITALGLYDVERRTGAVYQVGDENKEFTDGDWFYKTRTEKELLEDFWEGATSYDTFVTYNGRSFGLPFLLHRSVLHEVIPSTDIARQRYLTKQALPYHVDLLDELTLYGGMSKVKLTQFCDLYNIPWPKVGKGKFATVTNETIAITALYEKWRTYLAPRSFLNKLEF